MPIYFTYPVIVVILFCTSIYNDVEGLRKSLLRIVEVFALIIYPLVFLTLVDNGIKNDCCSDSVFFSPQHRLSIYTVILLCIGAYFYTSYRKQIAPPLLEVVINCLLLTGIVLNVMMFIQEGDSWLFYLPGCGSVILLFTLALIKNHQHLTQLLIDENVKQTMLINKACWKIIKLAPFLKFPILLILCLPILVIAGSILLLFGQKPDSFIRAFTDTYHLGFSQLNAECDNVQCGGHYLCSVAANGHATIVKPKRMGERAGGKIICNRQLLVSNAFEELLQEKLPFIHKPLRRAYNKVGNVVHKCYGIFDNKFLADTVYFLMKPLEWFFIITLYMFDNKPENRIAKQYLRSEDRKKLKMLESE